MFEEIKETDYLEECVICKEVFWGERDSILCQRCAEDSRIIWEQLNKEERKEMSEQFYNELDRKLLNSETEVSGYDNAKS